MANIQPRLDIVINPANPVQEVCEVIKAVSAYHPNKEAEILRGLIQAVVGRLDELKPPAEPEAKEAAAQKVAKK
jgi:hypothetical protein